jgi:hypothetical protein
MALGRCLPALCWATLLALACGSPSSNPAAVTPDAPVRSEGESTASAVVRADAASPSGGVASGPRSPSSSRAESGRLASGVGAPPLLASDSVPKGIEPLSPDERKELAGPCKPLAAAVSAAAPRANTRLEALAHAEEVLKSPPKLAKLDNVDVPRCSELMRRELRAYLASSVEAEAITHLKIIMVGMASAYAAGQRLCPSAPAAPAELGRLEADPYRSSPADWRAEGWRCVRFELAVPQRFQYEVRVDSAAQSFEIVARGFPVQTGSAEELFLRGRVDQGAVQPSSAVYRRR